MGEEITYTITHLGEEGPAKTAIDVVQVVNYICCKCEKNYKGLRCLQKHMLICGQPKVKRTAAIKRKIDGESSLSSPTKTSEDEVVPKEEIKLDPEPETDAVEVLPSLVDEDDESSQEKLCFCCEEPLENAHNGHVNCKLCKSNFHTYMGRDKHMINLHNSSENFKCPKCQIQCVSAAILEQHLKNHQHFVCATCGAGFKRRYHLDRHQEKSKCSAVEKQPHECDVCGKTFLRVDNLRVHLRGHLGQPARAKDHQCPTCEKCFFGASMLLIHMRTHTGERPFPCDLCTKAFPSNGSLRKHRRVHTGERPYECSFCGLRFAAKETLNRHVKTHTGNKAYKCDQCGVSFIQRIQLKNHMFHHNGQDGHDCPHCEEKFDTKASMIRHLSSQHDLAFKCSICDSPFARQEDLQSHEDAMHGNNKRFICDDCYEEFPQRNQLLEHVAQCVGGAKMAQPVLSCGQCGKVYKRHDLLVKHQRTAHVEVADVDVAPKKKRGRPRKTTSSSPPEDATATNSAWEENKNEIFNQLKQNMDATFPEDHQLQLVMPTADYGTERALVKVVSEILVGCLDKDVLRKVGWPKRGVVGTLNEILQVMGVVVVTEDGEDAMTGLHKKMLALLGTFIGAEYLESMTNNYSVDQILHYMAESVAN